MLRSLSVTNGLFGSNQIISIDVNTGGVFIPSPIASVDFGIQSHMSIDGPGWFVVRDPKSGMQFITRRGDFRLDSNNYLITARGDRVQGFNTPDTTAYGPHGDVQIDASLSPATTHPAATMVSFRVQSNGEVRVFMSDGTEYTRAQILLQAIGQPENIQRIFYDVFLAEADAEPAPALQPPGSAGLGHLIPGLTSPEKLAPLLTLLPKLGKPRITDEGSITSTGQGMDLAIRGPGAFIVRDPTTSELFATRAGMFLLDRDGYITTYDHKRLQGLGHDSNTGVRDVQIGLVVPTTTSPQAEITTITIQANGHVSLFYSDGTEFSEAQILLYDFHQPDQLIPGRLGQFSGVMAAQPRAVADVGQYGRGKTRIQGGGVELVNIPRDLLKLRRSLNFFPQGALHSTTDATDLAIDGPGFFLLKHPLTGERFVTRWGDFHLDANGYLVNEQSLRVQGVSDVARDQIGDLRISGNFVINRQGEIIKFHADGTRSVEGLVLIQMFKESYRLCPLGQGLYQNIEAAVPVGPVIAGTDGAGFIESAALESSPEPETLFPPARHGTRMLITAEPGSHLKIQAKDGRSKWKTISVIRNAPFEMEYVDGASDKRHRIYRVLATDSFD